MSEFMSNVHQKIPEPKQHILIPDFIYPTVQKYSIHIDIKWKNQQILISEKLEPDHVWIFLIFLIDWVFKIASWCNSIQSFKSLFNEKSS